MTTIPLPAGYHNSHELKLKEHLILHDVVSHWNSTYNMMNFTLKYRMEIDRVTGDKSLKLRRYELDNEDWVIIEHLVSMLEVCGLMSRMGFLI